MHLPVVNQPVVLRAAEDPASAEDTVVEYTSRVEGLAEGAMTLARPFGLPLDTDLDDGRPFEVLWTTATGIFALPVRVTERAIDGRIRVWHAEPIGAVRRTNRRTHVRVDVVVPVTLHLDEEVATGSLLDLSEAALRCQVERRVTAEPETLRAAFAIGGEEFDLAGSLLRRTPRGSATELVITLPDDERTATALRRVVFAQQIRARQSRT